MENDTNSTSETNDRIRHDPPQPIHDWLRDWIRKQLELEGREEKSAE